MFACDLPDFTAYLSVTSQVVDYHSVSAKRRRCQRVGDSLPLGTASRSEKTLRKRIRSSSIEQAVSQFPMNIPNQHLDKIGLLV
jgi:hypothetical protein